MNYAETEMIPASPAEGADGQPWREVLNDPHNGGRSGPRMVDVELENPATA